MQGGETEASVAEGEGIGNGSTQEPPASGSAKVSLVERVALVILVCHGAASHLNKMSNTLNATNDSQGGSVLGEFSLFDQSFLPPLPNLNVHDQLNDGGMSV